MKDYEYIPVPKIQSNALELLERNKLNPLQTKIRGDYASLTDDCFDGLRVKIPMATRVAK